MHPDEADKNLYADHHLVGVLRDVAQRGRSDDGLSIALTPDERAALDTAADRLAEGSKADPEKSRYSDRQLAGGLRGLATLDVRHKLEPHDTALLEDAANRLLSPKADEDWTLDDLLFGVQAHLTTRVIEADTKLEKAVWSEGLKLFGELLAAVTQFEHRLNADPEDVDEDGAKGGEEA